MTTALPAAATATSSSATEGDVKNWLTSLHDYLAGLLGTTGAVADALTALGIAGSTVTSFNLRAGAVTLASSDVTTALGFSPAHADSGQSWAAVWSGNLATSLNLAANWGYGLYHIRGTSSVGTFDALVVVDSNAGNNNPQINASGSLLFVVAASIYNSQTSTAAIYKLTKS